MADFAAAADRVVDAFNKKDFEALRGLMAPNLKFRHFNRDFAIDDRDEFVDLLIHFAKNIMPERKLEVPERVTVSGNMVVREGWYVGRAAGDYEGWSVAGQEVRHKTATFYLFDDNGLLLEWVDYG
ncbi:MAG: nuclear transport factor 2 family protein [Pseudomonadota bacterium]